MPSIAEIRQKFPQYNDMSDEQLADALHRKFYSDMPRDQFNAKIGFAPAAPAAPQPVETDPNKLFSQAMDRNAAFDAQEASATGVKPGEFFTTPEDQRGYMPLPAAALGAARMPADVIGAPVDIGLAVVNGLKAVGNLGPMLRGKIEGKPYEPAYDYIDPRNVPGSSESIADAASNLWNAAGGPKLPDYEEMDPRSKAAYQGTRFGAQAFGMGNALRRAAEARPPSDMPRRLDQLFKPYEGDEAATTIARDVAGGVGTGAALASADSVAPDERGPLSSLFAGLIGGIGGQTLFDMGTRGPMKIGAWVNRSKPDYQIPLDADGNFVPRGISNDAAVYLVRQAGGEDAAKSAIGNIEAAQKEFGDMGAPMPPTGQVSDNIGLARVERTARNMNIPESNAILDRDRELNQFASDQIRGIAKEGDPNAFPQIAEQGIKDTRDTAQQGVDINQAYSDLASQQRQQEAAPLAAQAGQVPKDNASTALDQQVVGDMADLRQRRSAALDSNTIDPNNEVTFPGDALRQAAEAARQQGATLPRPLAEWLDSGRADLTLSELNDLRAPLADYSRAYEKGVSAGRPETIPQREAVDAMRNAVNQQLRDYAANGGTEQAQRLAEGLKLGDEFNTRYRDPGPGDAAVKLRGDIQGERGDMTGRSNTPPTETAGRFLHTGPGGREDAGSLARVMDTASDPQAIANARRDFILSHAADNVLEDGKVSSQKLGKFVRDWQSVIDQAPETAAEFKALVEKARKGEDLEGSMAEQLRQAQGRLKMTEQQLGDSAFAVVAGKTGRKAVESIFQAKNPPDAMRELVGKLDKVPGGKESLQRALSEYLEAKLTNTNTSATLDGSLPPSYSKMVNASKNPDFDRVLAEAYKDDPEAMQALQRARRVLEPRQFLENAKGTAGSPTASNLDGMMRMMELGLRTLRGGFKGGNTARNIKVALGGLLKGRDDEVQALIARAQTDPRIAKALLSRQIVEDPAAWQSNMRKVLNWGEAARQMNDTKQDGQ